MACKRPRQEEDVFLDVRGQAGQVHDLADACPADLTQSGQCGQVRNHVVTQERVELERQGYEPRYPRDAARLWSLCLALIGFRLCRSQLAATLAATPKMDARFQNNSLAHELISASPEPSCTSTSSTRACKWMESLPLAPSKSTRWIRSRKSPTWPR